MPAWLIGVHCMQFMTGDALLVSPVLHWNMQQAPAYFPPGRWYSLYDFSVIDAGVHGLNSTVNVRTPCCQSDAALRCLTELSVLRDLHGVWCVSGSSLGAPSSGQARRRLGLGEGARQMAL